MSAGRIMVAIEVALSQQYSMELSARVFPNSVFQLRQVGVATSNGAIRFSQVPNHGKKRILFSTCTL
jgi:hypothetical protein